MPFVLGGNKTSLTSLSSSQPHLFLSASSLPLFLSASQTFLLLSYSITFRPPSLLHWFCSSLWFFVKLLFFSPILCSSTILTYFCLLYLCVGWMFCSQIHEHREEHKKSNNFFSSLRFFVLLSYLTIFLCSFPLLDRCFALKFISTVKNTKKLTNFFLLCDFSFFYHI